MNFGTPTFFWAAFALLPLIAVYFIRTRPRRLQVNTFFLYQTIIQEKTSTSLFQRLRYLLSLLLLALAFLAAVLALTKPKFSGDDDPDLLIVIDSSVSMQTTQGGSSHLDLAKDKALAWIRALSGSQRAAVASISSELAYHANLTNRAKPLRDAVEKIDQTDLPLNPAALDSLALLADATIETKAQTRILFLTDQRSKSFELPAGIDLVQIGNEIPNVGITAADLAWDGENSATLFVSIASTFPEKREVEIELVSVEDDTLIQLFAMSLPAFNKGSELIVSSESVAINSLQPGPYHVKVLVDDAFEADDIALLGLNEPQPIPIQLEAENSFFFDQVISAFSSANSLFEPVDLSAQLALAEGIAPASDNVIVFAPSGNEGDSSLFWKEIGAPLSASTPEILLPNHPLLNRVNTSAITFSGGRKLVAPEGAVVVLAHPDSTPLIYTVAVKGRSAVIFNFKPSQNDFFLSPWFPVFVHDAAILLTGRETQFPAASPTGYIVNIPGIENKGTISHQSDGIVSELDFQSPFPIENIGNYKFSRDSLVWHLGASIFSLGESGPIGSNPVSTFLPPALGWPLASWFLLGAILVLGTEEILYQRRKVG